MNYKSIIGPLHVQFIFKGIEKLKPLAQAHTLARDKANIKIQVSLSQVQLLRSICYSILCSRMLVILPLVKLSQLFIGGREEHEKLFERTQRQFGNRIDIDQGNSSLSHHSSLGSFSWHTVFCVLWLIQPVWDDLGKSVSQTMISSDRSFLSYP